MSYMQQCGYHRLLRKLMVLPLLPANHLVPTFRALEDVRPIERKARRRLRTTVLHRHDVSGAGTNLKVGGGGTGLE